MNNAHLVHLTEQLSNPSYPIRRLFQQVRGGQIAEILKSKPRLVKAFTHRRFKQLTADEVDQLVREYCDGAGTVIELAKAHGVSESTVARRLRERGLELGRLSLSIVEIERARRLRTEGMSFNAIGKMLGRDPKTVKRATKFKR